MSWLFAATVQSIGASASASVLPMNIQDQFPLGWTGLISLQTKGLSRAFTTMYHSLICCISYFYILLIVYLRNQCKHEFAVLLFAAASPALKTWEALEQYLSST